MALHAVAMTSIPLLSMIPLLLFVVMFFGQSYYAPPHYGYVGMTNGMPTNGHFLQYRQSSQQHNVAPNTANSTAAFSLPRNAAPNVTNNSPAVAPPVMPLRDVKNISSSLPSCCSNDKQELKLNKMLKTYFSSNDHDGLKSLCNAMGEPDSVRQKLLRRLQKEPHLKALEKQRGDATIRQTALDFINDTFSFIDVSCSCCAENSPPQKKRSRDEVRVAAAKELAPRRVSNGITEWNSPLDSSKAPSQPTVSRDANDIESIIKTVTAGDPTRAAAAISQILNNNDDIKTPVLQSITPKAPIEYKTTAELITDSIRLSIAHHTNPQGGCRTDAATAFMNSITTSAVYGIEKNNISVSDITIAKTLGTTTTQVKKGREIAKELISTNKPITKQERKEYRNRIRERAKIPVFEFIQDDGPTRLDTRQGTENVMDPRTGCQVVVHKRIWKLVNKGARFDLFLQSKYYQTFREENDGATIGFTIFSEACGRFKCMVSDPKPDSCVDEKTTGMEHLMAALVGVLGRKNVKKELDSRAPEGDGLTFKETLELLKKMDVHRLVESVCCEKEEEPSLHFDETKDPPKFIPLKCTHGVDGDEEVQCPCCGISNKLPILDALLDLIDEGIEGLDDEVNVMKWVDARRQGQKNGKNNTQRELQQVEMTVEDLVYEFRDQLEICIPHCQEIQWIGYMRSLDFSLLPADTLLILTDFSAVMCLRALQTKNSSVDGHAVCANFVCIYNRRIVTVKKKTANGNECVVDLEVFDIDSHHFFAETLEKGKKNDHNMHNTCLEAIMYHYEKVFHERDPSNPLRHVIVWTDNAPHQYRCRQTFLPVASIMQRHPNISITHCLAVVDNFKGIHDAFGKGPSHLIRLLERQGVRSPTALAVFQQCRDQLEIVESKWKALECAKEGALANKGRFGMDRRMSWFVTESQEQMEHLSLTYPGRILLCDRSKTQDTVNGKAIEDTTELHEVRSIATEVPVPYRGVIKSSKKDGTKIMGSIREWPVSVANLPCRCKYCNVDPSNSECKFILWRRMRTEIMKEAIWDDGVSGSTYEEEEEADEFVSEFVEVPVQENDLMSDD